MAIDADLASWLRLTLIPGVGGETQRALLKAFGLPEAIFAGGIGALRSVVGPLADRLLQPDAAISAAIEAAFHWAS
ncbi:MAG: DNA-protecting protein DprA, partial [Pseudomonadota bacterium]